MKNIELKIAVKNFNEIKKLLKKIGAKSMGILRQADTYFNCKNGRLKIREINTNSFELIFYQRPDKKSSKISEYKVLQLKLRQFGALKQILSQAYGQTVIVKKQRELWIYKNTRIHLDKVDKLGNFLELETVANNISLENARQEHAVVIDMLNLVKHDKIDKSYSDLLK